MRKTSANRRLAKKRVQCLNEALCFEIRFFAKRQNVGSKQWDDPQATNRPTRQKRTLKFVYLTNGYSNVHSKRKVRKPKSKSRVGVTSKLL